jgi:hypothetical protein
MRKESLDEREILEVTGLPPAPTLPEEPLQSQPTIRRPVKAEPQH